MPTCFLIDDDLDDREIFADALSDADPSCVLAEAENGVEGIKMLQLGLMPDYIFLDLNMPFMSGKQALREIRKIPALQQIPVIIYTTSSYEVDVNETKNLGASHFMVKPSAMKTLTANIQKVIQKEETDFLIA